MFYLSNHIEKWAVTWQLHDNSFEFNTERTPCIKEALFGHTHIRITYRAQPKVENRPPVSNMTKKEKKLQVKN